MDCRRCSSRCLIVDRAIQRINFYPVEYRNNCKKKPIIGFRNTDPLKYSDFIFGG